jgi:hypothetical protein
MTSGKSYLKYIIFPPKYLTKKISRSIKMFIVVKVDTLFVGKKILRYTKANCYFVAILVPAIAFFLLLMPGSCLAENFVSIKIFPEHVGVFTADGKQQFVAFGYLATGESVNITKQVDWESSNKSIITIDTNGLAVVVAGKTSGQVKINCSYPKTVKLPLVLRALNLLLLSPKPEPIVHVFSAINILLL